ncbi:MAG TPA: phytoene/squalene synthase family protein [Sphingomonas sp.]|nr:phytoene/squalene synthase family protein [Sphingomonas sp.]
MVDHARRSIAHGSKSFGMASTLFDRATRERAWLLYAWCRACDDLADGQEMGHGMQGVADPAARLATIRERTALALAGEPSGDPAFDGFGVVARECAIPAALAGDLIAGFALDAEGWRPHAEDDLYRYCYHVAGTVGVMMALVMGVSPDDDATLDRACDLGLAFQLANIARDIGEDDAAGRCYLPVEWLENEKMDGNELMDLASRPRLAVLARRLAARSADYEASARVGAAALPFRAAWAVLAAAGIYGGIAREVAKGGERAWDRRVSTSKAAKVGWVARSFAQVLVRRGGASRPSHLWTRPKV